MKDINISVRVSGELARDITRCVESLKEVHENLESMKSQINHQQSHIENSMRMLKEYWPMHVPFPKYVKDVETFTKSVESP